MQKSASGERRGGKEEAEALKKTENDSITEQASRAREIFKADKEAAATEMRAVEEAEAGRLEEIYAEQHSDNAAAAKKIQRRKPRRQQSRRCCENPLILKFHSHLPLPK